MSDGDADKEDDAPKDDLRRSVKRVQEVLSDPVDEEIKREGCKGRREMIS